jgi:hypothetical protein
VCEDIIVKQNVIGLAHSTDWSCKYIDRYDVSDNFPPGLEDCMYHSMNPTTTTSTADGTVHRTNVVAIFGALLVGAVSVSVCAILQGFRHRYMEISRISTAEMTRDETSTISHRDLEPTQTQKGSISTVRDDDDNDDDDDDGLL